MVADSTVLSSGISVPALSANVAAGDFTVAALFKFDNTSAWNNNAYGGVFGHRGGTSEFGVFIDNNGALSFYDLGGTSSGGSGQLALIGQWQWVIMRRTAGFVEWMRDTTVAMSATVTNTSPGAGQPYKLGEDGSNTYNIHPCQYRAFAIWPTRAISNGEVLSLVNDPFGVVVG